MRTCVGCRRTARQSSLVRIARRDGGVVTIDRVAPGRGAWICRQDPLPCWHEAVRRRALPRAFRAPIDVASVEVLTRAFGQIGHDVADLNAAGSPGDTIRKG